MNRTLYGTEYQEYLMARSLNEAIIEYIEDWETCFDSPTHQFVDFYAHIPLEVNRNLLSPLEIALETLDAEYGNEEEDVLDGFVSETLVEAEKVFIDAILDEYKVYRYEPVLSSKVTVDLYIWMEENNWRR